MVQLQFYWIFKLDQNFDQCLYDLTGGGAIYNFIEFLSLIKILIKLIPLDTDLTLISTRNFHAYKYIHYERKPKIRYNSDS